MGANFENWQRPMFPKGFPFSIFGAEGLYFCVRNGNRCFSFAIVTSNGAVINGGYIT